MFHKPPESPKPPAVMGLLRCLPISTTMDGPTCTLLVIRLQIFCTTTITTVLLAKSAKRPVLHTAKRAPCRRGWAPPRADTPKTDNKEMCKPTFSQNSQQTFSISARTNFKTAHLQVG